MFFFHKFMCLIKNLSTALILEDVIHDNEVIYRSNVCKTHQHSVFTLLYMFHIM